MIIPMLCVTIFVILVVWFLLPRVARLMIHTPTAISIFVCLSMVQLMAVFISMRCTRSEERRVGKEWRSRRAAAAEQQPRCRGCRRCRWRRRRLPPSPPSARSCRPACRDRSRFFFSSRRRHTRSVSAFLLNRSSDLAEGRKANDSHADCYQYFCVPEYGTANGRLHFHAVHFMRTLPTGSVDPNFGRRVRNRRQLNSLQNTWPYGYSMPIAVRYTQD